MPRPRRKLSRNPFNNVPPDPTSRWIWRAIACTLVAVGLTYFALGYSGIQALNERRQGLVIAAVVTSIFGVSSALIAWFRRPRRVIRAVPKHPKGPKGPRPPKGPPSGRAA